MPRNESIKELAGMKSLFYEFVKKLREEKNDTELSNPLPFLNGEHQYSWLLPLLVLLFYPPFIMKPTNSTSSHPFLSQTLQQQNTTK